MKSLTHILTGSALVLSLNLSAQPQEGLAAAPAFVKNLAGCFTVTYRFVENGANDKEILNAVEWITFKTKETAHVIQHFGIFTDEETHKPVIMRHFSEEWKNLPNQVWQQKIFGPSGQPRYTCESTERFGQLRCLSRNAPKPQRDRHRTDYDVLNRDTSIQITPKGWVQSEVNDKIKRDGKVISTEVGWIEYRRTDEKACEEAKKQFPN